jgi:hypothetical protein
LAPDVRGGHGYRGNCRRVDSTFQHSQHPKPGELTIYGNAITRVLLAAMNGSAAASAAGRINVGYFHRFEFKLAAMAGGRNPDCTALLPLAKRLAKPGPEPEPDNPDRTQPTNP